MTGFIEEMDKLAEGIAKAANAEGVKLADKVDTFKALVPYYAQLLKQNKDGEMNEDEDTFDSFQSQIHATEQQNGSNESRVRSHSRRSGN